VFGHVGLSAARPVFLAQGITLLGLPTVLLAHHPGHGRPAGRATTPDELTDLFNGLEQLKLLTRLSAITTGYFATASQVDAAAAMIARIKNAAPHVPYWCDPVMGDTPKGLYVPEPVARAIQAKLLPLCDLAVPNAFEASWLTGLAVDDPPSALAAAQALGRPEVIVTSVPHGPSRIGALWQFGDEHYFADAPRGPTLAGGMGDCFAALVLARRLKGDTRPAALQKAVDILAKLVAEAGDQGLRDLPLARSHHLLGGGQ
jgi:pyridoxine kinase